jgi:hypothetical protein
MEQAQKMAKVILIEVDGPPREVELPHGLTGLQAAVRGWIEGLASPAEDGWVAYGNEEAKIEGLFPNLLAHALLVHLGGHDPADVLRGPVVLAGQDEDGEQVDVPADLMGKLEQAAVEIAEQVKAELGKRLIDPRMN